MVIKLGIIKTRENRPKIRIEVGVDLFISSITKVSRDTISVLFRRKEEDLLSYLFFVKHALLKEPV